MIRKPIRNLNSNKSIPPRFCDVIIKGKNVVLEVKQDRNKFETIAWEDLKFQVENEIKKYNSQQST